MTAVERWLDRALLGIMYAAAVALALMVFHITADVLCRYLLNRPFTNTVEVVSFYYMIAVVFLPLAFVERKSEHIEVELFTQYLPLKARNILFILARLFAVLSFGALAYQTFLDALNYTEIREAPMGSSLEIWPTRYILPLSFVVLMITMLLHAAKAALNLDSEKPQGDGPDYGEELLPPEGDGA